jgi:hypothetical protein
MVKSQEYHALLHVCSQEGCPICNLAQESTRHYLDGFKYEHFTDVGIREELRRTQGFCHIHTWQLVHMGASLPIAQAYRDVLSDTIDQLRRETAPVSGRFRRLLERPARHPECPACKQHRRAAERYIHSLRQALLDDEFYQQLSTSNGLCLEHFQQTSTLRMTEVPGNWPQRLQQAQLACLERLDTQLGELIRKHDYRFQHEEKGPEMRSWRQAAGLVAGEETI